jgi:hypothetical protein
MVHTAPLRRDGWLLASPHYELFKVSQSIPYFLGHPNASPHGAWLKKTLLTRDGIHH